MEVKKIEIGRTDISTQLQVRRQRILDEVKPGVVASIGELCSKVGASKATLRRDLRVMSKSGIIVRTRGGATGVSSDKSIKEPTDQLAVAGRRTHGGYKGRDLGLGGVGNRGSLAIARAALKYLSPNSTIGITGPGPAQALARLMGHIGCPILTNSLSIFRTLLAHPDLRITLQDGEFFREQDVIFNPFGQGLLQNFAISQLVIGTGSMSQAGLTHQDAISLQALRQLIDRSAQVIVLAESNAFLTAWPLLVCPVSRIDLIITDANLNQDILQSLHLSGTKVEIA